MSKMLQVALTLFLITPSVALGSERVEAPSGFSTFEDSVTSVKEGRVLDLDSRRSMLLTAEKQLIDAIEEREVRAHFYRLGSKESGESAWRAHVNATELDRRARRLHERYEIECLRANGYGLDKPVRPDSDEFKRAHNEAALAESILVALVAGSDDAYTALSLDLVRSARPADMLYSLRFASSPGELGECRDGWLRVTHLGSHQIDLLGRFAEQYGWTPYPDRYLARLISVALTHDTVMFDATMRRATERAGDEFAGFEAQGRAVPTRLIDEIERIYIAGLNKHRPSLSASRLVLTEILMELSAARFGKWDTRAHVVRNEDDDGYSVRLTRMKIGFETSDRSIEMTHGSRAVILSLIEPAP